MRRAAIIAVLLLSVLAALFFQRNPLTGGAQRYATTVAASAGGVYLTLRSLNAFLSTAQEIEVGGTFVVSGTAQPFKVLEPVDDTVERVAGLVFFVMVATGVLSVAMGPASALGYAMLAGAAALWLVTAQGGQGARVARRLGWDGAFLGLAVPLSFLIAGQLSELMTEGVMAQNAAILAEISAQADPAILPEASGNGWLPDMGGMWNDLDRYRTLAGNIYARADELVASLISILAVFIFRLLILPALLMGGLFVVARNLARPAP